MVSQSELPASNLRHTYEWVMSHIWMSHVTHMNESCHAYERVMPHIRTSHGICIIESCHTYQQSMAHIWMSHVTHINESCHTCSRDGLTSQALCSGVLQCVCRSVLQCVAVCCSVLQCVAVCCSVLQCVAVLVLYQKTDTRPEQSACWPWFICVCEEALCSVVLAMIHLCMWHDLCICVTCIMHVCRRHFTEVYW